MLAAAACLPRAAQTPVQAADAEEKNIEISVFWPPTAEYMNGGEGDERWDEQYALLQAADVDLLCNVTGRDRKVNQGDDFVPLENTKETNLKMAQYAAKYGMKAIIADERFGDAFNILEPDEIAAVIGEYKDVPGVGGYFLRDEPNVGHALDFLYAYEQIKKADPEKEVHFNFLPMWSYGTPPGTLKGAADAYRDEIEYWLDGCGSTGYPADYLMYDFYPYQGMGTVMNRNVFFANLDAVRKIGLEYGVNTAKYLQSIGKVNANRSPSPAEIRYEAMISLAYGYKQLSYFTWFLPTNRGDETFMGSIVDENGVPNEVTYGAVCTLNKEIHALGKTLARLDAREVYFNGFTDYRQVWGEQEMFPEDFFVRPEDDGQYALSLMKDRENGRNYLMFVNNDYGKELSLSVTLDGVSTLFAVSKEDGSLRETALDGGSLSLTLAAGDGALFALPEGMNFVEGEDPPEEDPPKVDPPEEDPPKQEPEKDPSAEGSGCGAAVSGGTLLMGLAVLPPLFLRRRKD